MGLMKYISFIAFFAALNCSGQSDCEIGVLLHEYFSGDTIYIGEIVKGKESGLGFFMGAKDASNMILNIDKNRDVKSSIKKNLDKYEFDCSILFFDNIVPYLSENVSFRTDIMNVFDVRDSATVTSFINRMNDSGADLNTRYIESFSFRNFYGEQLKAFTFEQTDLSNQEIKKIFLVKNGDSISRLLVFYPRLHKVINFYSIKDLLSSYNRVSERRRYRSKNYPRLIYYLDEVKCLPTAIGFSVDILAIRATEKIFRGKKRTTIDFIHNSESRRGVNTSLWNVRQKPEIKASPDE